MRGGRSQSTSQQMCTFCRCGVSKMNDRTSQSIGLGRRMLILSYLSVQVNIPAESGEMGVLANHVPSIEQLKPGLVEIIEESGGSKQFFCTLHKHWGTKLEALFYLLPSLPLSLCSIGGLCSCATRISAQHQCRGRFSLGGILRRGRIYLDPQSFHDTDPSQSIVRAVSNH